MRTIVLFAVVVSIQFLNALELRASGEPKPVAPTAEQLANAKEAYAKFGTLEFGLSEQSAWPDGFPAAEHTFRINVAAVKGGLKGLPDLPFPFGLNFQFTGVTDVELKELRNLKNLISLDVSNSQFLDMNPNRISDVGVRELKDCKNLASLNLGRTDVTGAGLKNLPNLTALILDGTKLTDETARELQNLNHLRMLSLANTPIKDAGVNEITKLKNLQSLGLANTQVVGEGIKQMKGLSELRYLNLLATKVTDAGLKELLSSQKLERLNLASTGLTDEGLRAMAGLTSLNNLDLSRTRVTGAGFAAIKQNNGIELLRLNDSPVTDAGLIGLQELSSLQYLHLGRTQLTDAGLMELKGLRRLRFIGLGPTRVTKEGIKALQEHLPLLQVEASPVQEGGEKAPAAPAKAVAPKAGFVVGRVTMSDGTPLKVKNTKITITISGKNEIETINFNYSPEPDADGYYEQKLRPGFFYRVETVVMDISFNNQVFQLPLAPSEDDNKYYAGEKGIVRNFVWKVQGARPRPGVDKADEFTGGHWFGATVDLLFEYPGFPPPNFYTCVFTLTPNGKMIDGSDGKKFTFTRDYDPLLGELKKGGHLSNLILGNYVLKGVEVAKNGAEKELLFQNSKKEFVPAVEISFVPSRIALNGLEVTVVKFKRK